MAVRFIKLHELLAYHLNLLKRADLLQMCSAVAFSVELVEKSVMLNVNKVFTLLAV